MKKLILGLFLLLVASSYAVPSFVNSKRAEERGYKVVQDTEGTLSIQKVDNESATTISYWYGVKFISSLENKRAHVLKFKDGEVYTYNFVPKKQKVKDYHISVLYITDKNLSGASLDKVVDNVLNEAESFLK